METTRIPIMKMGDILAVSVQVELHDRLVLQLQEDITNSIKDKGGKGLIIDVSGVEIMDSFIARSINDMAKNAKLMGTETVVVGIKPAIAITLVEMGMEMDAIHTSLNFDDAMKLIRKLTVETDEVGENIKTDELVHENDEMVNEVDE